MPNSINPGAVARHMRSVVVRALGGFAHPQGGFGHRECGPTTADSVSQAPLA
jgi:hypothetical protein